MNAALPIIDLTPLRARDSTNARSKVACDIDNACRVHGFFYLTGHGIAPSLIEASFAAAENFFTLPQAQKAKIAIEHSPCHRGWFAIGGEVLDAVNHPEGDYKEGIKIGRHLPAHHPRVKAGVPLHGANQWPDLSGWRAIMEQCYAACEQTSRTLMGGFALALNLPETYFAPYLNEPMATLAPLYYPPLAQQHTSDSNTISAGAHTDFGCLTLLMQKDLAGLEIQTASGDWCAVPPRGDMLVVNIGDMLARWTNDSYRSTRHRVRNHAKRARQSIAFFFDPDPDADLTPLPGCVAAGDVPHYPSATCLEHLLYKIEASFAYRRA